MANGKSSDRWESSLLAAVVAAAGTLFLFDRLGFLMRCGGFTLQTVIHSSPLLLGALVVGLMLADENRAYGPSVRRPKGSHHE